MYVRYGVLCASFDRLEVHIILWSISSFQIMRFGFPGLTNVRALDDYIISYDTRNRIPFWVCEHLAPEQETKSPGVDRTKCSFHEDLSIHEFFR